MIIRFLAAARSVVFSLLRIKTIGAMVLLIDERGVVLIRQSYGSGEWTLPGGGVKRGESPREAAIREVREETGATLSEGARCELFGLYLRSAGGWQDYVAVYVIDSWVPAANDSREISEVRQFPLDDLPVDMSASVKTRISEWLGKSPRSDRW